MKKFTVIFIIMMVFLALLTGCSGTDEAQPSTSDLQAALTVSAAASLTDCMTEIQTAFNEQYPQVTITDNFGSSGSLQQQIEQGAPADIFISAGKKQMTALKDGGLMVDESIKDILQNQLVLVVPSVSTATIDSFEKLADASIAKIAIGDPDSVPAGKYAQQVFQNLNIADSISGKLVLAKDVREVLSWVETGNVDAGVVYTTDALNNDKVKVCATASEGSHDPIVYPVGIVKASTNQEAAKAFVDFLSTDTAKEIFTKYGFTPIL